MAEGSEKERVGGSRVGVYFDGPEWVKGTAEVGEVFGGMMDGSVEVLDFCFLVGGLTTGMECFKVDLEAAPLAVFFRDAVLPETFTAEETALADGMALFVSLIRC